MTVLSKRTQFGFLIGFFVAFNSTADDTNLVKQVTFQQVLELPANASTKRYTYGSHHSQYIDYWPAPTQIDSAAHVIFIHGGCWLKEYDMSHTNPASSALSEAGFNVWSIEYRRLGEEGGDWPASLNDVKAAIKQIQKKLNGEPAAVMGHSAGGHLALLAASGAGSAAQNIKTVVGLAAITDIVSYTQAEGSCNRAAANLMNTAYEEESDYKKASPDAYDLHTNTWLIQGSADNIVPVSQTQGLNVHIKMIEGAGHFDLIHPHSIAWQPIIQLLNKELNP
ncbi:alpha/beta hydrolase family protein [Idiomarina ramblicola]|uniref:Alpha/beta hydrolase n=1 Tax=Idiomarina ramblicola TaxID=263724 RepID=A0A432YYC4_9GAMM|nr:alpha/beta hydrolase [Idiomarina ramblicola]RUO68361.1 alpha/beta hydrolase [Idiomarina ramblicola]